MTNIKFNIDPSDLPDDRINKHKDFKKLMYNYQHATKPLYKTPLHKLKYRRIFIILLLVLLVTFLLVEVIEKDEAEQNTPPPATEQKQE